jgi:hypothetical protein
MITLLFIPQLHGLPSVEYNNKNKMHKNILTCQKKIVKVVSELVKKGKKINLYSEDSLYTFQNKLPVLENFSQDIIPATDKYLFNYGASKILKSMYPENIDLVPIINNSRHSLRHRGKSLLQKSLNKSKRKQLHTLMYHNRETDVLSHIYKDQQGKGRDEVNILIFGAAHNFLDINKVPEINKLFSIKLVKNKYFKQLFKKYKHKKSNITKKRRRSTFRVIKTAKI